MLTIIAVVIVLIAVVLIYAATKPDSFRIERSATIKASPEKVFALINDFRAWGVWSPWEKMDPKLKRSFSGATSGEGTVYAWEGTSRVGAGRMEITESLPSSKIIIKLDFFKPFEAHNTAEFTLKPAGDSTTVTWAMYGPSPYIAKVMTIFFNMDKTVGKSFEEGLANMKAAAE
ncbi:MAG TPA: SRPBCC family protein [Rhodocyclaceae bacterium]|nr:SRPBCC family protein [Rhodocyclaceae bacterium]